MMVAHIGWAGVFSEVGPIIAFCMALKKELFMDKELEEQLKKYDGNQSFDERKIIPQIKVFSSGVYTPKSKEANQIQKAINTAAMKAILGLQLINEDKTISRPKIIICEPGILKFNFSDIKIMEYNGTIGVNICKILSENIRRRFIEQMCEMSPILKIYGLQENYGKLDKKHKKAIKENGPSFFHRRDIFISEKS